MTHRHAWVVLAVLLGLLVVAGWYVGTSPALVPAAKSRIGFGMVMFSLLLTVAGLIVIQSYDRRLGESDTAWQDEVQAVQRAREMLEQRVRTLEQEQRDHAARWQEVQQTLDHARREVETLTRETAQERARADRVAGELEQVRKTQVQQEPVAKELRGQVQSLTKEKVALTNEIEQFRQQTDQLTQQVKNETSLQKQLDQVKEALATSEEEKVRWINQAGDIKNKVETLEKEVVQKAQEIKVSEGVQKKIEESQKKFEEAERKIRQLETEINAQASRVKDAEGLVKKVSELEKLLAEAKAVASAKSAPPISVPIVPTSVTAVIQEVQPVGDQSPKPTVVPTPVSSLPDRVAPPKPAVSSIEVPPKPVSVSRVEASPVSLNPIIAPVSTRGTGEVPRTGSGPVKSESPGLGEAPRHSSGPIKSESPGIGEAPRHSSGPIKSESPGIGEAPRHSSGPIKSESPGIGEADVLVVDGNGTMLNQYRNELYKLGFSVHVARTGQDGIRKLGLTPYAFLLVNLEMSDMTWEDFVEKVKKTNEALANRIVCCIVPGGKNGGIEENIAKSGVKWFKMPLGIVEFQALVKQVSGRS